MTNPYIQPLPPIGLMNSNPYGFSGSAYSSLSAPTTMSGLDSMYSGTVEGPGFMPGSVTPGATPAAGGWMDQMNGAWSQYGDMVQGIGGLLQGGIGIYGMLQNVRLARKQFEHQKKGDILSYNMMVQNQRNYQEDRADINAGAAKARGRYVTTEAERQAEVDRRSVKMWDE